MKRLFVLLCGFGALAFGQDVANVRSVYLLPMAQGMDQYLANWLTQDRVFRVVTDPKRADAVFTDRIGQSFEDKLADLIGSPDPANPPASAKADAPKKDSSAKDESRQEGSGAFTAANKLPDLAANSTFGRGKGTVFLVDPKSHRVLWSAYRPPRGSGSDELNRTASAIVSRLKRDLKSQ